MDDLEGSMYPEALAEFSELKTKYPYSKYAALADLRMADTQYERNKYLEAIDAYRQFLKLHPNHGEAPYAMFRIGDSYSEQMPEDWWFLPPPEEKDQANTRLAISAYQDVLARYPESEYAAKAKEKLDFARRRLADHEMYVARFYWKRAKWRAAAGRADGLVRDFGGLGLDAEALLLAAEAHARAGDADAARSSANRLIKDFPSSSEAASAARLLENLGPATESAQPRAAQGG